jgi:hypothetical protein
MRDLGITELTEEELEKAGGLAVPLVLVQLVLLHHRIPQPAARVPQSRQVTQGLTAHP